MPREVTDDDGTTWQCVQAFSEVDGIDADEAAARMGEDGGYRVVCTPSGGAQSRRLELEKDWEDALSDDDLLAAIAAAEAPR